MCNQLPKVLEPKVSYIYPKNPFLVTQNFENENVKSLTMIEISFIQFDLFNFAIIIKQICTNLLVKLLTAIIHIMKD